MKEARLIIVTRHPGAVEWIRRQGLEGEVIPHATSEQIRGRVVIGNLPLYLAAEADVVGSIDLPNLPPELRGQDLTPEQMDEAGACLVWYAVGRGGEGELGYWAAGMQKAAILHA